MMQIEEYSGNIKLRLPKSLHALLVHQSQVEGVSLNQLCLMYLSNGIGRENLGADQFDYKLELIANECVGNEEKLFKRLGELNEEIERIKPNLLYEYKLALDSNKRQMDEFIEVLRYIYPICYDMWDGKKRLMLKIPSAKIVLSNVHNDFIDQEKIENIAKRVCEYVSVSYGDYDRFIPFDDSINNKTRRQSIVVNILCNYPEIEKNIYKILDAIIEKNEFKDCEMTIKPCYLGEDIGSNLNI